MTINRVCGSGARAVVTAAQQIAAGEIDAAIAGGMENMDRAPYLMGGGRWGYRMGPAQFDSMLTDGLNDAFSGEHSGWHTEDVVTRAQLSRDDQDRFAARSQQRAAAQAADSFADEIVAVEVKGRKGPLEFAIDEAPRPETTVETLAKLKPLSQRRHDHAGSAPGLNSGAAAVIVASAGFAESGTGSSRWPGSPPTGSRASNPACSVSARSRRSASRSGAPGWSIADIERIEINEAFAAVPLAVAKGWVCRRTS